MSKNPDYLSAAETAAIKIVLKHVLWLVGHQRAGLDSINVFMDVLRDQCLETSEKMSVLATGPVDEIEFRKDLQVRINSFFDEMRLADVAA